MSNKLNSDAMVRAFKRNCPRVRLNREEEEELARLFRLAMTVREFGEIIEEYRHGKR